MKVTLLSSFSLIILVSYYSDAINSAVVKSVNLSVIIPRVQGFITWMENKITLIYLKTSPYRSDHILIRSILTYKRVQNILCVFRVTFSVVNGANLTVSRD